MGQAKHKKSRCNCGRIGVSHKPGCAALNPIPILTTVILTMDKGFAEILMKYHALVADVEPSPGGFIVRMIQDGLDLFITKVEEAAKKDRIVTIAGPGDLAKIGSPVRVK